MKKNLLGFVLVSSLSITTTGVSAQAPVPPEIEDPQCLGINKEPPHATLMPYATMKEASITTRLGGDTLSRLWNK